MQCDDPTTMVDHLDRNRLNNRRDNLRQANSALNSFNFSRPLPISGYRGVRMSGNRFIAKLGGTSLGSFATAKAAAIAYNDATIEEYGFSEHINHVDDEERLLPLPEVDRRRDNRGCIYRKNGRLYGVVGYKGKHHHITNSETEEEIQMKIDKKYAELVADNSQVPSISKRNEAGVALLTCKNGEEIQVDDDIALLYYDQKLHCKDGYAKVHHQYLHRVIMQLHDSNMVVDHIDGNIQNACRSNLRIATKQQNATNRKRKLGCASSYRGVSKHSAHWWKASFMEKGKKIHIGLFRKEIMAATAMDIVTHHVRGDFGTNNNTGIKTIVFDRQGKEVRMSLEEYSIYIIKKLELV
ncbi:MAG: HNH endonuclease [Sphingobacteriaceae bacterium]|nr:MAG: HNH endonuclease [Sphingobacteriaceae bacterium]